MDLIDRAALIASASKYQYAVRRDSHPYEALKIQGEAFRKMVDEAPAIDVVPVVLCKDCKWRHTKACIYEYIKAVPREDNDFCSDGERRSDDA